MIILLIFFCTFANFVFSMNPQKMRPEQTMAGEVVYGPEQNPLLRFLERDDIPYNNPEEDNAQKDNIHDSSGNATDEEKE